MYQDFNVTIRTYDSGYRTHINFGQVIYLHSTLVGISYFIGVLKID